MYAALPAGMDEIGFHSSETMDHFYYVMTTFE
jgi:hypothetical protein